MPSFELVTRQAQTTAVIHEKVPVKELPQFFQRALGQVYAAIQAQGAAPAGPPFALYFGMPSESVEVEAGFPVSKAVARQGAVTPGSLPGGRCAHGMHVGPYETLKQTYDELMGWMAARNLKPADEMWEVYWSDPAKEPNPAQWRTEIFWPVQ